jgi:hypothetical protein
VELDLPFANVDCSDNLEEDLPRMSGDEVDLLSILEVEFLLEIPRLFGLRFYILCCTSPLPANFF